MALLNAAFRAIGGTVDRSLLECNCMILLSAAAKAFLLLIAWCILAAAFNAAPLHL
jgi:hypothetical protein